MSVCNHLSNQITQFKWKVENYVNRVGVSISGDEWTSDVFTLNSYGNPKSYLTFCPPINYFEYSSDHSFLDHRFCVPFIKLELLDPVNCSLDCDFWLEDENGNVLTSKGHAKDYERIFAIDELQSFSTISCVFICCEISVRCCDQQSFFDNRVAVIDRTTQPIKFSWNEMRFMNPLWNTTESKPMNINEQSFRFESDIFGNIYWKNLGNDSDEHFHFMAWVENSRGERTRKIEGIRRLFKDKDRFCIWSISAADSQQSEFFYDNHSRFHLLIRRISNIKY
ncbi:hypothetical protein M3Y98_00648300 [Aphelenchoides besseyi]|nr:hypothetical protein M3Y98_00648300 [Aphelenchoides besseyi]KAI6208653.1 hypothetical protein M3Y96_00137700 [Aphelenchoides besseyi]